MSTTNSDYYFLTKIVIGAVRKYREILREDNSHDASVSPNGSTVDTVLEPQHGGRGDAESEAESARDAQGWFCPA